MKGGRQLLSVCGTVSMNRSAVACAVCQRQCARSLAARRVGASPGPCVRVYDGDTIWLAFEHAGEVIRCSTRLLGVDTAEIRTRDQVEKKAALGARDELRHLILGKMLRVRTTDTMDKYGRLLADVWLLDAKEDEPSINSQIVARWGVPYTGGHKERVSWSEVPRAGTSPL